MATLSRRITIALAAAALIGSLAQPALAQVSPAMPGVGPAGGTPSTTAPSNNEGTPAGGTGVVGRTRVDPNGLTDGRIVLNPQQSMDDQRPVARPARAVRRQQARQQRRAVRRQQARAARPVAGAAGAPVRGDASAAGLNASNAPSNR